MKKILLQILVLLSRVVRSIKCILGVSTIYVNEFDLLKGQKSIIRWGDGESKLLLYYGDIHFQRKSFKIAFDLLKVLFVSGNVILCFPRKIIDRQVSLRNESDLVIWGASEIVWNMLFLRRYTSDAMMFRRENPCRKDLYDIIKNEKKIFSILSKEKPIDVNCNFYIKVPSENSYEDICKIQADLYKHMSQESPSIDQRKKVVLISMGPAGKVLIARMLKYRCAREYQFIDVGHMFDHNI